jgi:SAM-dependent methyltransferase
MGCTSRTRTIGSVSWWKDLFSRVAADYAQYRPSYPAEFYAWLADVSPAHELAVDVGSGNGQAAVALAAHFAQVVGVEPSEQQISNARADPRVRYVKATAEATGLPDRSADLVLAAQSFHWFDRERFFAEVERLLRPGGVLALVTYALSTITPEVDAVVDALYEGLDPYWEPERRLVETGYATVELPYHELDVPTFIMHATWNLEELMGYLGTWSARHRALEQTKRDPLAEIAPTLAAAWGDPAAHRVVTWPLAVRAVRLS